MRERGGKERGEILNEDGREIRWMKEIWRERIEKERRGDRKKCYFLELLFFMFVIRNSKAWRAKKAFIVKFLVFFT
jgi:hypothetical protein